MRQVLFIVLTFVQAGCAWEWAPGLATDSAPSGSGVNEPTSGSGGCGDGVVDAGEACDDGSDCIDGVCNSDDYAGKPHCKADCSEPYEGGYCGVNADRDPPAYAAQGAGIELVEDLAAV